MDDAAEAALRQRWRGWAEQALGGTEAQLEAAADAVMQAIRDGASQVQAIEAARAAWSAKAARPQPPTAVGPGAVSAASRGSTASLLGLGDRSHKRFKITGRVEAFGQRNELQDRRYVQVWNFRVVRPDSPPVAVEMRGFGFEGAISNGDEVGINAKPNRRGVVHVESLTNLSSNCTVSVTGTKFSMLRALGLR